MDMNKEEIQEEEEISKSGSSDMKILISVVVIAIFVIIGVLLAAFYDSLPFFGSEQKDSSKIVEIRDHSKDSVDIVDTQVELKKEIGELQEIVEIQRGTIKSLEERLSKYRSDDGASKRLSLVIKPKPKYISVCESFEVGSWEIPSSCLEESIKSVKNILENDRNIVAWEIVPIVDEKPYRGLSPELKQKGLASFRAEAIIGALSLEFDNLNLFIGVKSQESDKRGYKIRAYFVD